MPVRTLWLRIGMVRKRDKLKFVISVYISGDRKSQPSPSKPAPYISRRLLVTTVTLESAIAAEATIGESNPSAAIGIPRVL